MSGLLPLLLAQRVPGGGGAEMTTRALVCLAVIVFWIVGMWKMFEKAGQPGWASLIPIYNLYVKIRVAGRPVWWLIFYFIPPLNLILIIIPFDIATRFGKGVGFALGLLFLPFLFYPILGFGDARDEGLVGEI